MNIMFDFDLKYGDVIGVDEAGRGPLAGPVTAASVKIKDFKGFMNDIKDSKRLNSKEREHLSKLIKDTCEYSICSVNSETIDKINILEATFEAMRESLKYFSGLILVDGNLRIKGIDFPQEPIIKGDSKSLAIAAASILAKVARDSIMYQLDTKYPEYGFKNHKGYGTLEHIENIKKFGPSPVHRKSFLKNILG